MPVKLCQCQSFIKPALLDTSLSQGQAWAGDLIVLLTHANHLNNLNCADGKAPSYN
jgi:transposase